MNQVYLKNHIRKTIFNILKEAYHSKDVYDRKREYAAKKMDQQRKVGNLTEEQHDALEYLCKARHDLHSNMDSIVKFDEYGYKQNIIKANVKLYESELKPMGFVGYDLSGYVDIDDINLLKQIENVPDIDSEEYQDWYDGEYYRIYGELEELNKKIENYLSEIDEKYGTNYCPTGLSRKF
jgi:hypothetical protein